MTKGSTNNIKKNLPRLSPRQMIFCFMSLFSLALIIRNSDVAISFMSEGLSLCVRTVIPSLFPFMVISDLLVSGGAISFLGRILERPCRALFGVSGEGGCAVLLGALCGFPIGARSAVNMYDTGKISRRELERLLTFSNNPSSAFIISAVGISLFGARELGVRLYAMTLLSSLAVGIAQNIIFRARGKNISPSSENAPRIVCSKKFGIGDFTEAITSSALALFKVCAFVVFFTAFLGTLSSAVDSFAVSQELRAIIFGVFEMTGGMAQAAEVSSAKWAKMIAGFVSGWSGLSVHFQIMSLCADRGVSFKPYFAAKIAQGILCALFMSV